MGLIAPIIIGLIAPIIIGLIAPIIIPPPHQSPPQPHQRWGLGYWMGMAWNGGGVWIAPIKWNGVRYGWMAV